MGKGDYLGGSTRISPEQNPGWFGNDSVEDQAYRESLEKFEQAKVRYHELIRERDAGAKGKAFRKRLEAARDAMDAARPRPRKAVAPIPISPRDEQRIATLKRNLAAQVKRVQAEAATYESLQQEFIALLNKLNIPLTKYPETRRLKL